MAETVEGVSQDTRKRRASTTTDGDAISLRLGEIENVDIGVDVSNDATLTVNVSSTGDFSGEEIEAETVDLTGDTESVEQFNFSYPYVEASVDQNLETLELIGRG